MKLDKTTKQMLFEAYDKGYAKGVKDCLTKIKTEVGNEFSRFTDTCNDKCINNSGNTGR
jgi:hypothetical protein